MCSFTVCGFAGKSYFGIYVLIRCLSEKRTVLYTNSYGRSLLFDEDGIHEKDVKDVHEVRDFVGIDGMWSLVDPSDKEIPPRVSSALPFYFVFASPQFELFKELIKRGACQWVMTVWSETELLDMYVSSYTSKVAHFRSTR